MNSAPEEKQEKLERLSIDERIERARPRLGPGSEQDIREAADWVEEIKSKAGHVSQDPLYDWRGELNALMKALNKVLNKTQHMRKKMRRPALFDPLDAECSKWIELCQYQLNKSSLPGAQEFRQPRRHDADAKRRAAERARYLQAKYDKPGNEHELATILYGDPSADLREYCGPQISEAVGLAGRFFFDFPSRGAQASGRHGDDKASSSEPATPPPDPNTQGRAKD
jgi:hypothetical protein